MEISRVDMPLVIDHLSEPVHRDVLAIYAQINQYAEYGDFSDLSRLLEEFNGQQTYVACEAGRVLGVANYTPSLCRDYGWINGMATRPERQRSGVGSFMIRCLSQTAINDGRRALELYSAPEAVRFYRKLGFTEIRDYRLELDDEFPRMRLDIAS
ncbi:MAG: Acetyltransferase domain [Candidatus Saccharibacteria bacterium]|nr:Acetyltransferase domain [Candidatus Saccharibacteria bacterium]